MSETPTPRRGRGWMYAAAWLPFLTIYLAAFIANDVPVQLSVRDVLLPQIEAVRRK